MLTPRRRGRVGGFAIGVLGALQAGCPPAGSLGEHPPVTAPMRCAFLAINDTYHVEPLPDGFGGFAAVRGLRVALQKDYPDLVMLHAGDFLFPSFLSRRFKGAQMIDVMNALDGSPGAFDDRMFVVAGNHEFEPSDSSVLASRIRESELTWLASNVRFGPGPDGKPQIPVDRMKAEVLLPCGGGAVGLFGLTVAGPPNGYVTGYDDPVAFARESVQSLRKQGARVVVALTHQDMDSDIALVTSLGADAPDFVAGGHEHARQTAKIGSKIVAKADADARSASVFVATADSTGVHVEHSFVDLGPGAIPADPDMKARVSGWVAKNDLAVCEALKLDPECLNAALTTAGVDLIAEELQIRRFETNLGDFVADQLLGAFATAKETPQIAFINAGSLRLNYNLPKGTRITRRHVEELFAYRGTTKIIRIRGDILQKIIERSIEAWTGNGHFLQVAGFSFIHDPTQKKARALTLTSGGKARLIRPDEELLAVTNDFLMDPTKGQDGYTMLRPEQVIADGPDVKDLVLAALQKAGDRGISPVMDGRICTVPLPSDAADRSADKCQAIRE